ncbi:MAG: hypothetical protein U1E26_04810 [Coriobacteriia bacterium]|nr:hypothetical protein [Coriobacteriia bacterium]
MTSIQDYSMIILFVVYGLTFFVMAGVLWFRLEQTARIGIAGPMVTLVAFAVLHGISDIVDVVLRLPGYNASPTGSIAAVRMVFLVASFLFLAVYGALGLIRDDSVRRSVFVMGMVGLVGIVAAVTALFAEGAAAGSIADAERATRLYIALPGGLLAALALYRAGQTCGKLGMRQCREGSIVAAAGMVAYAIFAGGIATGYPEPLRLIGLPIQLYRMGSAAVLTVGIAWMLDRMSIGGK